MLSPQKIVRRSKEVSAPAESVHPLNYHEFFQPVWDREERLQPAGTRCTIWELKVAQDLVEAATYSAGVDIDAFEERVTRMLDPIKQVCAERISATMSASRATKDKVRTIEEALGVVPGPLEDIENLLGAPPAEGTPEFDW